jgi:hypothetical protein
MDLLFNSLANSSTYQKYNNNNKNILPVIIINDGEFLKIPNLSNFFKILKYFLIQKNILSKLVDILPVITKKYKLGFEELFLVEGGGSLFISENINSKILNEVAAGNYFLYSLELFKW